MTDNLKVTRLKTLKDIKTIIEDDDYSCGFDCCKDKIRQEAIKWIKFDIEECNKISDCYAKKIFDLTNKVWMKRFNITSKELENA